jgi:hypothetical protein
MIATLMQNDLFLGGLCYALIVVPVIGMQLIHKYNWQHWEPFAKGHK